MEIDEYRRRIDTLDAEIVRLINERAQCALQIYEGKVKSDLAVFAPDRERQVLERVTAASQGPLGADAIRAIYTEIIGACRELQRPLTVAYWGPAASNTFVAARRRFGSQARLLETGSVAEVFEQVARGAADCGVVPVENSTEGVVAPSLDQFMHHPDLRICAEIYVPIHHNLLSRAESVGQLRRVYTMWQATSQCRNWIGRHLGHVELVEVTTTARGAILAADDPEAGAIANHAAAEQYGLRILAENIEDNPRNRTRFWVIGRVEPEPVGRDKTSLLFSVPHAPGALVRALDVLAQEGVSLTFIESRPTRQNPWEYLFFIDVLGHERSGPESPLGRAMARFRERCQFVRVLGSYPEAE